MLFYYKTLVNGCLAVEGEEGKPYMCEMSSMAPERTQWLLLPGS